MQKEFWLERWDSNNIGFHNLEVNSALLNYFPKENLQGKCVFVPLCGKSQDLIWLRDQGLSVIGSELSKKAVLAFFNENNLSFETEQIAPALILYKSQNLKIYQGDIFQLPNLGQVDFIYDRAALIALPPEMRKTYIKKLKELSSSPLMYFLITIEYDQSQMDGPPFSVPQKEVEEHFQTNTIKLLNKESGLERGIKDSEEKLFFDQVIYQINL